MINQGAWGECASIALCAVVNDLIQFKYAIGLNEEKMQHTVAEEYEANAATYPGDLARKLDADKQRFFRGGDENNAKKFQLSLGKIKEVVDWDALCDRLEVFSGIKSCVVVYEDARSKLREGAHVTHAVAAMSVGISGGGCGEEVDDDRRVVRARNSWGRCEPLVFITPGTYRYHVNFDPKIEQVKTAKGTVCPPPPVHTAWPGAVPSAPSVPGAPGAPSVPGARSVPGGSAASALAHPDAAGARRRDAARPWAVRAQQRRAQLDSHAQKRREKKLSPVEEFQLGAECDDPEDRATWYWRSAQRGCEVAQCNLGFAFQRGEGVPKDEEEAVRWYTKAALQGHAVAQSNLGYCYDCGEGVGGRDAAKAIEWYAKAAEQGLAEAQCNVGRSCYVGEFPSSGGKPDFAKAAAWYKKAAAQGLAVAMCNLGHCYEHGHGVEQSWPAAVRWWKGAAAQGHADAQRNLQRVGKLLGVDIRDIDIDGTTTAARKKSSSRSDQRKKIGGRAELYAKFLLGGKRGEAPECAKR